MKKITNKGDDITKLANKLNLSVKGLLFFCYFDTKQKMINFMWVKLAMSESKMRALLQYGICTFKFWKNGTIN